MRNSALTVPSRDVRLVLERRASRTARCSASRVAQRRREVGHLLVAARRRAPSTPTPARRGRRAGRASASVVLEQLEVHRGSRWRSLMVRSARCASPSTSPTPASPRAAPPSSSIADGPRDRRRRDRHRPGARRRRATSGVAVDGELVGAEAAARRLRAQQAAGRRLDRAATPTAARPSSISSRAPGDRGCTRSGASTPTRTGLILLTDDGELANRLTHPRFEVPEDLPRHASAGPPCATGAARAARGRRARGRHDRARRACAGCAADELELTIHEGRKRQVRRMCEAVGHPVRELRADRASGRCSSATSREGQSPPAHARRDRRAAPAPAGDR